MIFVASLKMFITASNEEDERRNTEFKKIIEREKKNYDMQVSFLGVTMGRLIQ